MSELSSGALLTMRGQEGGGSSRGDLPKWLGKWSNQESLVFCRASEEGYFKDKCSSLSEAPDLGACYLNPLPIY